MNAQAPEIFQIMHVKPMALVAEDDPGLLQFYQQLLEMAAFDVRLACSGMVALDAIREQSFDLVISDNEMPQLTGKGLFQEACKLRPELKDRFIFVSASMERTEEVAHCTILSKPFDPEQLLVAIEQVLTKNAPQRT